MAPNTTRIGDTPITMWKCATPLRYLSFETKTKEHRWWCSLCRVVYLHSYLRELAVMPNERREKA